MDFLKRFETIVLQFKNLLIATKDFLKGFEPYINLLTLIVAIIALFVARSTLEHADNQFKESSKSSDSLFQVQLINSKGLNDSLVKQIKGLQSITSSQLKMSGEQLKVWSELYKDQLFAGRPKIRQENITITDTDQVYDHWYSPKIAVDLINDGSRTAYNISVRAYCVNVTQNDTIMRGGLFNLNLSLKLAIK